MPALPPSPPTAAHLDALLHTLAETLTARGWMMVTAESCTGGLIAAACTELPGSSRWFERGSVTYSNAAKTEMLGVPAELIEQHGAVSEEVARAMAHGAAVRAGVQVAVAVTGTAGPEGGSQEKPVGTVWLGLSIDGRPSAMRLKLEGDRRSVRNSTVHHALNQLCQALG